MTTVSDNSVVEMNYTLTSTEGDVLDSSQGKAPLAFIMGQKNIIPGLEKEILGKNLGDSFDVKVEPEEAYGLRDERMIQNVPKEEFGTDIEKIQVGTQFQLQDANGQVIIATAIEVGEETITLDANHPLAGETLNFAVEIVSVREATEEELAQGYLKPAAASSCCDTNDEDGGCC